MKTFLLLLPCCILFPLLTNSQPQDIPLITVEKISDNLFQLTGGRGANSGK